jgi:hypothetical protein
MTSLETSRLADFLRSRGAVVHESLELFGGARGGERGVYAVDPIKEGTLLLRLPASAVVRACENGPECDWMPSSARATSPMLRTALFLMREVALGQRSEWAPYLSRLPLTYDTLEHWSQEELAALRGTSVHDEISSLRDSSGDLVGPVRVLWDKDIAPIVAAAPEHWPGADLDAFLSACAAVRTRGFYDTAAGGGGPGGPYMLPAIDMLNHARQATATTLVVERSDALPPATGSAAVGASDQSGAHAGASSSPLLIFSMEAERDLAAGDELVHVYAHRRRPPPTPTTHHRPPVSCVPLPRVPHTNRASSCCDRACCDRACCHPAHLGSPQVRSFGRCTAAAHVRLRACGP